MDQLVLVADQVPLLLAAHPLKSSNFFKVTELVAHDGLRRVGTGAVDDDKGAISVLNLEEPQVLR